MNELSPFDISAATHHANARPRDARFYQNPYAFYAAVHATSPTFFWEEYGHWCFTGFDEVSALLRDRRFGREILHVMTREQLGWPAPKPHLADFDLTEKFSLLNLEPPDHTRLMPASPAASRSEPIEAAWPTQSVATAGRMNCMVS